MVIWRLLARSGGERGLGLGVWRPGSRLGVGGWGRQTAAPSPYWTSAEHRAGRSGGEQVRWRRAGGRWRSCLQAKRHWGAAKCGKFLARNRISEVKPVGELQRRPDRTGAHRRAEELFLAASGEAAGRDRRGPGSASVRIGAVTLFTRRTQDGYPSSRRKARFSGPPGKYGDEARQAAPPQALVC